MNRIIGSFLAAIIAIGTASTLGAGSAVAEGCPPVAYFAIGGNTDTASTNVPHVPAGQRTNIEYPADVFKGDYSRKVAGEKLDASARQLRDSCPETRIGVYGFSLGASAGSLVVDEWQTDPVMNQNTYAVFYGNPRHPVGPDGWGGIEAAGLPNIPFVYTWHGERDSGPIPVTDICNPGQDIICSSPTPLHRNLIGAWNSLKGYLGEGHKY